MGPSWQDARARCATTRTSAPPTLDAPARGRADVGARDRPGDRRARGRTGRRARRRRTGRGRPRGRLAADRHGTGGRRRSHLDDRARRRHLDGPRRRHPSVGLRRLLRRGLPHLHGGVHHHGGARHDGGGDRRQRGALRARPPHGGRGGVRPRSAIPRRRATSAGRHPHRHGRRVAHGPSRRTALAHRPAVARPRRATAARRAGRRRDGGAQHHRGQQRPGRGPDAPGGRPTVRPVHHVHAQPGRRRGGGEPDDGAARPRRLRRDPHQRGRDRRGRGPPGLRRRSAHRHGRSSGGRALRRRLPHSGARYGPRPREPPDGGRAADHRRDRWARAPGRHRRGGEPHRRRADRRHPPDPVARRLPPASVVQPEPARRDHARQPGDRARGSRGCRDGGDRRRRDPGDPRRRGLVRAGRDRRRRPGHPDPPARHPHDRDPRRHRRAHAQRS